MKYIIELEPSVWLARNDRDGPEPTTSKAEAYRLTNKAAADRWVEQLKEWRTYKDAKIEEVPQ
jgi:hypothetical protein